MYVYVHSEEINDLLLLLIILLVFSKLYIAVRNSMRETYSLVDLFDDDFGAVHSRIFFYTRSGTIK